MCNSHTSHHSCASPGKKQPGFRQSLSNYIFWITAMWTIWFVTGSGVHPWPIYPTLFWGFGLIKQFRKQDYVSQKKEREPRPEPTEYGERWDDQWVTVHESEDNQA